jgi:hypothetical protein
MNRHLLPCCAFIFCVLLSVAQATRLTADDLKHFEPISAGVREAADVTVFEGLPHQMFEGDLSASELKLKKTVEIGGFPFYERPLSVSADDVEALRKLLSSRETYHTFGGEKLCGGFHPDYGIAWQKGTQVCYVLVCFGCREFKLFGVGGEELRTDSDDEAFKKIREILKKYQSQRPVPKTG